MGYDIESFCIKICKSIGCEIKWKAAEAFQKERVKRDIIERKNICEEKDSKKYKFIEYTLWDEKKDFCVIIGFNPKTDNPDVIDDTNRKIIENTFFNDYGGIVLLNLYPQVSSDKKQRDKENEEDKKYSEKIPSILKLIKKSGKAIVVFWGREAIIDVKVKKILSNFESKKLYKTVKKETLEHYHPARVEIEIKQLQPSDFKGCYYLN